MPRVFDPDLGKGYGKPDLERLGLFVEMPYMNGKKYVSPFEPPKRHKGMTFLTTGYKSKNGTQHGYFEEEFRRLFEGEGITWRKPKQTGKRKKIGPLSPFIVGIRGKTISTPGDYFGTFSGKIDAFSNVRRKKPKYVSPNANFQTSNPKKGGPGYANICINPYPTHMRDPYKYVPKKDKKKKKAVPTEPMYTAIHPEPYFTKNPFIDPEKMRPGPVYVQRKEKKVKYSNDTFIPTGPAKWPGGCHGGCFDPFPEWKRCKYVNMLQANKPFIGDKGTFYPQSKGKKTLFTRSVLQYNTDLTVNSQNYKKAVPTYTKYLLNC